jgi:hypothetical protein
MNVLGPPRASCGLDVGGAGSLSATCLVWTALDWQGLGEILRSVGYGLVSGLLMQPLAAGPDVVR